MNFTASFAKVADKKHAEAAESCTGQFYLLKLFKMKKPH